MGNKIIKNEALTSADALHILQSYDSTEFHQHKYKACNITVPTNFEGQRIKNGEYKNCKFNGNNFEYVGASGTIFGKCELNGCQITGANMQFCDFSRSIIRNNTNETHKIEGTNFNQSSFYKTFFHNVWIENASVSQAQFLQARLENTHFRHATLQDNLFRDTTIRDSSFVGCNMEYSNFVNVSIKNTILPFHQIPYIYGGIQCITDPKNEVMMSSSMENAPILSAEEYVNLLPAFKKYYESEHEYFPLANIALFSGEYEKAKRYINNGLKECIRKREFRKIKALCKLAIRNGSFKIKDLTALYFDILKYFQSVELSPGEQYQFGLHIDEIKNILFNTSSMDKSYLEMILKTNVAIDKDNELIKIISIIEDCLHYNSISTDDYSLELKHNSPTYSLWLVINTLDPNILVMATGMLHSIFTGNMDMLMQATNVSANIATIAMFISSLKGKPNQTIDCRNEKDCPNHQKTTYVREKHKLLKDSTSINFSIGKMSFNYERQKTYQSEG